MIKHCTNLRILYFFYYTETGSQANVMDGETGSQVNVKDATSHTGSRRATHLPCYVTEHQGVNHYGTGGHVPQISGPGGHYHDVTPPPLFEESSQVVFIPLLAIR